MKIAVALCSDIITWIGTGNIDAEAIPSAINNGDAVYTNLELQGGSSLTDPDWCASHGVAEPFLAAYVEQAQGTPNLTPTAELTDVKLLDQPVSTEGA